MRWDVGMDELWSALRLGDGGCVAVIGAGGKTTTILALSHLAVRRGLRTIVTTTTKIWPPAGIPLVVKAAGEDLVDLVRRQLQDAPCVAVGSSLADNGKVIGLEPWHICSLVHSGVADVVLCEADGAAGRSLKVHGPEEPVIPVCAVSVVVVAGLDVIGHVPGPENIHRFECFLHSCEADRAGPIDASTVARVLVLAAQAIKSQSKVVFVLNKADNMDARREAGRVAEELATALEDPVVIASSHLAFIEREAMLGRHIESGSGAHDSR